MRVKRVCTTMMHFTSCLLFNIILIIYIFSYEWFYVRFYTQKCKLKMFTLNNGYLFLFRSRDNDVRLKFFCVIKRAVYSMFYLVLQSFSSSLTLTPQLCPCLCSDQNWWTCSDVCRPVLHAVFIVWQPQAMYTVSSVQCADGKWWSVGGALDLAYGRLTVGCFAQIVKHVF